MKRAFSIGKKILFAFFVVILIAIIGRGVYLSPKIKLDVISTRNFLLPTHVIQDRIDETLYFVTEKHGRVVWFKENNLLSGITLDISEKIYSEGWEEGLLGIVPDKNYPDRPYFYVFYSMDNPKKSVVSRFRMNDDNVTLDKTSELVILKIPKTRDTHNGGMLEFGADGYLYISIGDSENTSHLREKSNLRGTIVRIDVSNSTPDAPYAIPPDNPFVAQNVRKEIYADGFRNPWRFSFDSKTNQLYVGDVGSNIKEEISRVEKGGDYGWPIMEGDVCRVEARVCEDAGSILPLASFSRLISVSIVGGYVYRGNALPELYGHYVFADYLRGVISINFDANDDLITAPGRVLLFKMPTAQGENKGRTILIVSFHEEKSGELLAVNLEGTIHRMVPMEFSDYITGFLWSVGNFH